jgi:hypothetical protein
MSVLKSGLKPLIAFLQELDDSREVSKSKSKFVVEVDLGGGWVRSIHHSGEYSSKEVDLLIANTSYRKREI